MTEIVMPQLSDSMETGTVLAWLIQPGQMVCVGDELMEIETDKATVTHVAEAEGTLEILVDEGTTLSVGEPIARLHQLDSASHANGSVPAPTPASSRPSAGTPESDPVAPSGPIAPSRPVAPSADPVRSTGSSAPKPGNGNSSVSATPLARRIAEFHGIALTDLSGTGPLGRITRSDVLSAAGLEPEPVGRGPAVRASRQRAEPPAIVDSVTDVGAPGSSRRELTRLQQLIARRMAEAKATIPHFQVQTEVVMDQAIALRARFKAETDPAPSLNDLIIKVSAVALRDHPLANASYKDGLFELHEAQNVGMAVAADDALIVPTVFDAATKSLGQIASETRALAARVREGSISPPELAGATFTVSNLGMFGMTAIMPVINPPQAAILGVGSLRPQLVRRDDDIVERQVMTLTLSCDHRILYGAEAARFLGRIRELLENPLKLVL